MSNDEIIVELPLSEEDWRDMAAMLADWRAQRKMPKQTPAPSIWVPSPIFVTNDSGEEIPPFACMQATGTEERDGQNYLIVDKPADATGAAGPYVFNGPESIAIGDDGLAQNGSVFRAIKDGSPSAGAKLSPTANQWYLSTGSLFVYVGDDDIATDVCRVVLLTRGIINLRLSGNNLQYTFDNTNWTTWHTATECPP